MDAETPNEVIGVLAHETGHIQGGHLARLREQVSNAQALSVVGMLFGAGAMAGAVASDGQVGGAGTGAVGVFAGGQELVRRNLLSYQRSEEQAADQAAMRYLGATGQSPKGMLATFGRFADSGLFRSRAVDPYLVSHPLPTERIAQLETLGQAEPAFRRQGLARPPGPPRPDAGEAVRLRRSPGRRAAALSSARHLASRPLRPRRRHPPERPSRRRPGGGGRPSRRSGEQRLLSRAERPDPARIRPRPGSGRPVEARGGARPERRPDPGHARPGARRDGRPEAPRRGHPRTDQRHGARARIPARPSSTSPPPTAARATSAWRSSPPRKPS